MPEEISYSHLNAAKTFASHVPDALLMEQSDRHVILRIPLGVETQRRSNFFQLAAKAGDISCLHNVTEYIAPSKDGETSELKSKMSFKPEDFSFAFVCFARKPLSD